MRNQQTRLKAPRNRSSKVVLKRVEPLPFSGRNKQQLVQLAAVTAFTTLCLFTVAHFVKSVTNKINETHVMSTTILKSSVVTNSAIGTLIGGSEDIMSAIEKLPNNDMTKEIKQLNESVNKLRGAVNKRTNKKKVSYNYPVIEPVKNGHM